MKHGVIPSTWLGILGTWNSRDLLRLKDAVDRAGIERTDLPAVMAMWKRITLYDSET